MVINCFRNGLCIAPGAPTQKVAAGDGRSSGTGRFPEEFVDLRMRKVGHGDLTQ